jgi:hypothetical protein
MVEDGRVFVDSGAEWSILPGDIARGAGIDIHGQGLGRTTIHTRLGTFTGFFERFEITLPAEDGDDFEINVTWIVAPEWYGPMVLGWTAGLDRFRWGVDPDEERFHFGRLEDE